jgi:hypothetical protein
MLISRTLNQCFLPEMNTSPVNYTSKIYTLLSAICLMINSNVYSQASSFISADDARRKAPLSEALEVGCAGVSLKVKLDDDGQFTCAGKSFENVYLKNIQSNNALKSPFLILLEMDGDSLKMMDALNTLLTPYNEMLSKRSGNSELPGKLKIIVWGDIPYAKIKTTDNLCYFALSFMKKEGVGSQIANNVGINFDDLYNWNGRESMPNMQYHSMQMNLKAVHKGGQKTFMFKAPETFNAWNILSNAGADYFVVEDLVKCKKYLLTK